MPRRLLRIIAVPAAVILLAQLACAQLTSWPAIEAPAAVTPTPEIEAVVFEPPDAGQRMLWTDSSPVVLVPGGSFVMGQDEAEPSDHSPAHTVSVSPFWIYQAEVTNRMYSLCVEVGACTEPTQSPWYGDAQYENAPVSGVDWTQAQDYCQWMSGRLPTEAEWELAARGTEGDPYPWGKDAATCDLGNFLDCLLPSMPDDVRSYPLGASPYKVADMAGNVSEWVFDWYAEDYYATLPESNPFGPSSGEAKVVRGSSYLTPVEDAPIYLRNSTNPIQSQPTIGFRCVVNSDAPAVAPACNVLSYQPDWDPMSGTPQPTPEAGTAEFDYWYCGVPPDDAVSVWIWTSWDIEDIIVHHIGNITITSPQGDVTCKCSGAGHQALCEGSAFQAGQPVTVTFCVEPPLPGPAVPECPPSYEFNQATNLCEYHVTSGGGQCDGGTVVEGYGCLYPPQDGQCPAGYYSASYDGNPVCVPAGGPVSPDLAACPEGLVFNAGSLCCEYPPDVSPGCPVGFTLNEQTGVCDPVSMAWCTSVSGFAPECKPTKEPPPEQKKGCWIAVSGPPVCVFPCPDGVPNSGACTP